MTAIRIKTATIEVTLIPNKIFLYLLSNTKEHVYNIYQILNLKYEISLNIFKFDFLYLHTYL